MKGLFSVTLKGIHPCFSRKDYFQSHLKKNTSLLVMKGPFSVILKKTHPCFSGKDYFHSQFVKTLVNNYYTQTVLQQKKKFRSELFWTTKIATNCVLSTKIYFFIQHFFRKAGMIDRRHCPLKPYCSPFPVCVIQ